MKTENRATPFHISLFNFHFLFVSLHIQKNIDMTKDFIKDPIFPECPIRNVLARIGGKWTLAVIYTLGGSETPLRFKDIERANPDCSQKMLTQTLRGLEADGLICRTVYPEKAEMPGSGPLRLHVQLPVQYRQRLRRSGCDTGYCGEASDRPRG